MDKIKIELPYLPPASFSPNSRCHWSKRHEISGLINSDVYMFLRQQFKIIPLLGHIKLHYTIIVPDQRRRDYTNFLARCKPIEDALVYAKLIKDDAPEYIDCPSLTFKYQRGHSATIIEIEEVDFESNVFMFPPSPCNHKGQALPVYGHAGGHSKRDGLSFPGTDAWREGMGIDWMTGNELAEAIPPAYTEFIGKYLMQQVTK